MSGKSTDARGSEIVRGGRQARMFAALGSLSGCIVWILLYLHHLMVENPSREIDLPLIGPGHKLRFDDFSMLPGFVFGVVIGLALHRRRLVSAVQVTAYVAAAIVANFVATNLAYGIVVDADSKLDVTWIGMIAGFAGAACLTLLSLPIFPFCRQWRVGLADEIGTLGFLILYGVWQAGYAAALATAVANSQSTP